jgi:predicted O-methyltransferase YrrM
MAPRTAAFADREHGRYWWFKAFRPAYDPPIFAMLDDEEWATMKAWYEDTELKYGLGTGECAVPAMTMLHSFVMGNNISRVVQLGHFIGFSTLLLGFALRKMKMKNALLSVDIDPSVTEYTQGWVDRAGLNSQVLLKVGNSADANMPREALSYLGGDPQLIFIDSSHQYRHTLDELALWYPALQPGGVIMLHDVSRFAASFDRSGEGGVAAALDEWEQASRAQCIRLNGGLTTEWGDTVVYRDGCGLGIIQKPFCDANEPTRAPAVEFAQ